jgi:hypothetical protein
MPEHFRDVLNASLQNDLAHFNRLMALRKELRHSG